jgi:hypothetical protein
MTLAISIAIQNYVVVLILPAVLSLILNLTLNLLSISKYNQKKNAVFSNNPMDLYEVGLGV